MCRVGKIGGSPRDLIKVHLVCTETPSVAAILCKRFAVGVHRFSQKALVREQTQKLDISPNEGSRLRSIQTRTRSESTPSKVRKDKIHKIFKPSLSKKKSKLPLFLAKHLEQLGLMFFIVISLICPRETLQSFWERNECKKTCKTHLLVKSRCCRGNYNCNLEKLMFFSFSIQKKPKLLYPTPPTLALFRLAWLSIFILHKCCAFSRLHVLKSHLALFVQKSLLYWETLNLTMKKHLMRFLSTYGKIEIEKV